MQDDWKKGFICSEAEKPLYDDLIAFMETKEPVESSLIAILHHCQHTFGYIPQDAMSLAALYLGIPISKVYGVVTFYSFFTEVPKGKYAISVCLGTACYVKGAQQILGALENELKIEAGGTTEDRLFSIVETRCLGDCANAPIVMVNDEPYGHMDADKVRKLVRRYRKEESENA